MIEDLKNIPKPNQFIYLNKLETRFFICMKLPNSFLLFHALTSLILVKGYLFSFFSIDNQNVTFG